MRYYNRQVPMYKFLGHSTETKLSSKRPIKEMKVEFLLFATSLILENIRLLCFIFAQGRSPCPFFYYHIQVNDASHYNFLTSLYDDDLVSCQTIKDTRICIF